MGQPRKLVIYPDPLLHVVSQPVEQFDDDFQQLVDDMIATMIAANGIGLSAIQVGVPLRVLTFIDIHPKNYEVFVNPVIVESDGVQTIDEGCLSVPGVYESRQRAEKIIVDYQDRYGEHWRHEMSGLEAFCVQHEIDHLDGKVFIDDFLPLKERRARDKIRKSIRKFRRQGLQKVY